MSNDDKLVRALLKSTKENEIKWKEVDSKFHKQFLDYGENIENAYYYPNAKKNNNIIIYKAYKLVTDEDFNQFERANIHIVISKENGFQDKYKISDFELDDSSQLWILYKQIQRQASGADEIIREIIDDLNPLDF